MKSFMQLARVKICDMVIDDGKVLRDWVLSTLIPIYNGKGDALECPGHIR